MQYDVSKPVDKIFNAIEDLADLMDHAKIPMTEAQKGAHGIPSSCPSSRILT